MPEGTTKWGFGGRTTPDENLRRLDELTNGGTYGFIVTDETVDLMEKVLLPDFTDRVKAGMDLLDKVNPGWQDTLNFDSLDLESDQQCVLGQSWPLYAKARGLAETTEGTDFRKFTESLTPVGSSASDKMDTAAAIGCALSEQDFFLLNGQMTKRYGFTPMRPGAKLVDLFWEHLTRTWIGEIIKAKAEGRWDDAASSASTPEAAESATTAESTSTSSDEFSTVAATSTSS